MLLKHEAIETGELLTVFVQDTGKAEQEHSKGVAGNEEPEPRQSTCCANHQGHVRAN